MISRYTYPLLSHLYAVQYVVSSVYSVTGERHALLCDPSGEI